MIDIFIWLAIIILLVAFLGVSKKEFIKKHTDNGKSNKQAEAYWRQSEQQSGAAPESKRDYDTEFDEYDPKLIMKVPEAKAMFELGGELMALRYAYQEKHPAKWLNEVDKYLKTGSDRQKILFYPGDFTGDRRR